MDTNENRNLTTEQTSSSVPYAHTMADRSPHLASDKRRTTSAKDAEVTEQYIFRKVVIVGACPGLLR